MIPEIWCATDGRTDGKSDSISIGIISADWAKYTQSG